jgi:shikimate 5-dehydrogenase
MGYPVEIIGKDTKLFSVIGSSAIEHKLEKFFNRYFQEMNVDCKAMPLNIREDDLGFFLNGLKDSKIKAVFLEKEYWQNVYALLNPDDEECTFAGICDTIDIVNNNYQVTLTQGRALVEVLKGKTNLCDKNILIMGNSPSAKSFLYNLVKENPQKIIFADEYIEEMLELITFTPESIAHDIERITDKKINIEADISLNFTNKPISTNIKEQINFNYDFDTIVDKIAQIKTKEWSQNG